MVDVFYSKILCKFDSIIASNSLRNDYLPFKHRCCKTEFLVAGRRAVRWWWRKRKSCATRVSAMREVAATATVSTTSDCLVNQTRSSPPRRRSPPGTIRCLFLHVCGWGRRARVGWMPKMLTWLWQKGATENNVILRSCNFIVIGNRFCRLDTQIFN